MSARDYTPLPPSVPNLRLPRNDVYEGSVITGSLRPRFVWEASTASTSDAITYELQLSADPKVEVDVTTVTTTEPSYQPDAALPVSTVPPVGRRYFWRVRSCLATVCSDFSPTWWVNLGRSSKDFNGDGYADVAVGEPGYDNSRGRVHVYFGGPGATFDTVPNGILYGLANESFGYSVASGADFNADGYADLLVYSLGEGSHVQVFSGGPGSTLDTSADVALPSPPNEYFGETISSAGDVNSDGFADVLVGARSSSVAAPRAGGAYLFFGGPPGERETEPIFLAGNNTNGHFGDHVASAGDMNGDGFADFVVSKIFGEDPVNPCPVHVYLGAPRGELDNKADWILHGDPIASCGQSATTVGDMNDDGNSDLLVGISNGVSHNSAEIYAGSKDLGMEIAASLKNEDVGDQYLGITSPAGDVNGDGTDDLMFSGQSQGRLRVAIYLGKQGSTIDVVKPAAALLTKAGYSFGYSLSAAGDVNGDGHDDVVVGAYTEDTVYLYFGNAGGSFEPTPDGVIVQSGGFGFSVM